MSLMYGKVCVIMYCTCSLPRGELTFSHHRPTEVTGCTQNTAAVLRITGLRDIPSAPVAGSKQHPCGTDCYAHGGFSILLRVTSHAGFCLCNEVICHTVISGERLEDVGGPRANRETIRNNIGSSSLNVCKENTLVSCFSLTPLHVSKYNKPT